MFKAQKGLVDKAGFLCPLAADVLTRAKPDAGFKLPVYTTVLEVFCSHPSCLHTLMNSPSELSVGKEHGSGPSKLNSKLKTYPLPP